MKKVAALAAASLTGFAIFTLLGGFRTAHARNTNISVDSSKLDLSEERVTEDRFRVPIDETTELGFTENGDPAVRRQF